MTRHRNPPVGNNLCSLCGCKAQSFSHLVHRGSGGDPRGLRTDGFHACGRDHQGNSCHALYGQHHITAHRTDGVLYFTPDEHAARILRSRGVEAEAGVEREAREGLDPDAIDC